MEEITMNLTLILIIILYIASISICYQINKWLSMKFWNDTWTNFDTVMCIFVSIFSIISIIAHIVVVVAIVIMSIDVKKL